MNMRPITSILSVFVLALAFAAPAYASEKNGTIVSGGNAGYAWSNQAGWVNFGATNSNIAVTDSAITGYAWNSNYGWINMAPTNGGITIAANGALSGYAWGSSLGWINFSGVSINSSGKFTGAASGNIIGTLTFDCTNCDVRTDYRPLNFRTVTTPTPTSLGGRSGDFIQQQQAVIPPAVGLDTSTFPPGVGEGGIVTEEEELLPAQLFDIRLLLDRDDITRVEDLVARVTFESFGRVPTPVSMTFTIYDEDGRDIWSSVDTTTVQTSAVFVKRFLNLGEFVPGSYTLRLETLYNVDVRDTFEAKFTIAEETSAPNWLSWFIGGILFAILLTFVFVWRRPARPDGSGHSGGRDEGENKATNFP